MCTIFFSWKKHPKFPLILIANRDEFYERETKNAHWWPEQPHLLAGKDLKAGGTWMGVNKMGRFAAVTNFRKLPIEKEYATSRGDLVKNFLISNERPIDYMRFLRNHGHEYEGFNLLFGTPNEMYYYGNMGGGFQLNQNIHGLSNAVLDTPWPKVEKGRNEFERIIQDKEPSKEAFFELLKDDEKAPEEKLPKTGLSLEMEKLLSSIYIESERYGTRLSTILTMDQSGKIEFHERAHLPKDEQHFEFKIDS